MTMSEPVSIQLQTMLAPLSSVLPNDFFMTKASNTLFSLRHVFNIERKKKPHCGSRVCSTSVGQIFGLCQLSGLATVRANCKLLYGPQAKHFAFWVSLSLPQLFHLLQATLTSAGGLQGHFGIVPAAPECPQQIA